MPNEWLQTLENSTDPIIRFLYHTQILGEDAYTPSNQILQGKVKNLARIQSMLKETILDRSYQKWRGAHWVLMLLAEMGYPSSDKGLFPLREAEMNWLLDTNRLKRVPLIEGRYRRCASQEGNGLYALVTLGLVDNRLDNLVEWLLKWQWQDGGWNCDKKPEAHVSSFHESLIPLRGLIAYNKIHPDNEVKRSIERASEFFLQRHLFRRLTNNHVIKTDFTKICYPHFWHYDILFGLQVLSEAGKLADPRCAQALDLLQSKQLATGGFPAELKYYRVSSKVNSGASPVDWGKVSDDKLNEFVSVQAWSVLKQAGRVK